MIHNSARPILSTDSYRQQKDIFIQESAPLQRTIIIEYRKGDLMNICIIYGKRNREVCKIFSWKNHIKRGSQGHGT